MNYSHSQLIADGAMTGTSVIESEVFDLRKAAKWSFQLSFTRTTAPLAGNYKVQVSNDDINYSTWADLAGATGSVSDVASGSEMKTFDVAHYAYAKVVYTNSTGVGVLNIQAVAKE